MEDCGKCGEKITGDCLLSGNVHYHHHCMKVSFDDDFDGDDEDDDDANDGNDDDDDDYNDGHDDDYDVNGDGCLLSSHNHLHCINVIFQRGWENKFVWTFS